MAYMSTPAKLQNARFNFVPSDEPCEPCGSPDNTYLCDSDFGLLSIALCLDCIDADYDPNAD